MYAKQTSAVNHDLHRASTYRNEGLPTPRYLRFCSKHQCGPHLEFTDWDDVLAVLDDGMCVLRLADTVYIMPQFCEPMWGNA
jgi:hypothetical protein